MKFTEPEIVALYDESLNEAEIRLSTLAVSEGRIPRARGLNGWIFEQTIRHCLSKELEAVGLRPPMQEQVPLNGRVRIDLLVGKVAIELKARGSFGAGDTKYNNYRLNVENRRWVYFYLTQQEGHAPYRKSTETSFGVDRAFFLDTKGDWERFINAIIATF